jgi:transcriptional regulator with XRE-family HTH domain
MERRITFMKTFSNFGEAVRFCRAKRNLTLDQLAAKSEIGASFISKIERNENDNLTTATRAKIAAGLDVPVWTLEYLASGECNIRRRYPNVDSDVIERAMAEYIKAILSHEDGEKRLVVRRGRQGTPFAT